MAWLKNLAYIFVLTAGPTTTNFVPKQNFIMLINLPLLRSNILVLGRGQSNLQITAGGVPLCCQSYGSGIFTSCSLSLFPASPKIELLIYFACREFTTTSAITAHFSLTITSNATLWYSWYGFWKNLIGDEI
jgi:hypothetical protein